MSSLTQFSALHYYTYYISVQTYVSPVSTVNPFVYLYVVD